MQWKQQKWLYNLRYPLPPLKIIMIRLHGRRTLMLLSVRILCKTAVVQRYSQIFYIFQLKVGRAIVIHHGKSFISFNCLIFFLSQTHVKEQAKRKYYQGLDLASKLNMKFLWKTINDIAKYKKKQLVSSNS